MRVLNLYAGIGGNRKLWTDVEVTAIEYMPDIAKVYSHFFPKDTVIVGDAHDYLIKHYKEFDFIWSSPPCPSHSDIRRCGVHKGQYEAVYPDMKLYEEIILLKNFSPKNTKWVVENVKPYYEPLIYAIECERHLFWSNFFIGNKTTTNDRKHNDIIGTEEVYGFDISEFNIKDKRKIMRNLVNPYLGLHVFNEAKNNKNQELFN